MNGAEIQRIDVVDSHTAGEPTRLVLGGGPDLGSGDLAQRRDIFRKRYDWFRQAVVNEPRGSDVLVGALLCQPVDATSTAAVIFFNNVGYLGMCGHATIGLVATLAHLGKIKPGEHRIETPVGVITTWLHPQGDVTIRNVASYRTMTGVRVSVEGYGQVVGDVAWGGNWFFLAANHGLDISLQNLETLIDYAWKLRQALDRAGMTGVGGEEIDHIELFGPPQLTGADSKNFVLCPGKAYDRSPCGTGTSAKLACLVADGKFQAGDTWRQESIVGGCFEGAVEIAGDKVYPLIRGAAYITSEAVLILESDDPFRTGIGV